VYIILGLNEKYFYSTLFSIPFVTNRILGAIRSIDFISYTKTHMYVEHLNGALIFYLNLSTVFLVIVVGPII